MLQRQKGNGAVLYDNYGSYNPRVLSVEETGLLVRYCIGIVHNKEGSSARRVRKAEEIIVQQGHKALNYFPPALADKPHLDDFVALISKVIAHHPDNGLVDSLARNLTGALSNEAQQEGALRALGLEQVCGAAMMYVAGRLEDEKLYPVVSAFFNQAAQAGQHRQGVFEALAWAAGQPRSAVNAAFLLSSLAARYGWEACPK